MNSHVRVYVYTYIDATLNISSHVAQRTSLPLVYICIQVYTCTHAHVLYICIDLYVHVHQYACSWMYT